MAKTVVKHEAFALRRQRERHSPVTDDGHLSDRPTPPAITHDQAERLETLSQGAEALARLKPHEIRALVLKAEGYSYREICELTGWSYTKVNRLLDRGTTGLPAPRRRDPGRRRVRPARAAAVGAGGRRGERRAARPAAAAHAHVPRLPRRAQGVPRAAGEGRRPGATRRGQRRRRVRGFVEAALANLQQKADSALGAVQHKTAALGERAHAAVELAAGQKIAAVAASAAALAGGGPRSTTSRTTGSHRRNSNNSSSRWMPRPSRRRRRSRPHRRRSTPLRRRRPRSPTPPHSSPWQRHRRPSPSPPRLQRRRPIRPTSSCRPTLRPPPRRRPSQRPHRRLPSPRPAEAAEEVTLLASSRPRTAAAGRSRRARGCSASGPGGRSGSRRCARRPAAPARTCPPPRPARRRRGGT